MNPLPGCCAEWGARSLADAAFLLWPRRRRIALDNLERAFGPALSPAAKRALARRSFQSAALTFLELLTVPKFMPFASERIRFENHEALQAALDRGKGAILALSHLGSWEYMCCLVHLKRTPACVVVRRMRPPALDRVIAAHRRMMGPEAVIKDEPAALKTMLRYLKEGRLATFLIDQWDGPHGVWVDFFGESTSTTSLPARLSARSGAPVFLAYCLRRAYGRYTIVFSEPMTWDGKPEEAEYGLTLKLNRAMEAAIRRHPDQWLWGHRRWKPRPGAPDAGALAGAGTTR
jgi:KDO2-lipid IV(A) lauroyltransferase